MANKTIKLTLEGEPAYLEAIAQLLRECLEITYESKNQRIRALSPGVEHVRRVLRVAVPAIIVEEGTDDQAEN